MTAEIAVMNRQAVALAADSAVTVQNQSDQKIFNTVNKLFMLSEGAPVGIMIYGGAQITGVPWETVIKEFRRELASEKFATLEDYARKFIDFLQLTKTIFPLSEQQYEVSRLVSSYFIRILNDIKSRVGVLFGGSEPVGASQIRNVVSRVIRECHAEVSALPILPGLTLAYEARIRKVFSGEIEQAIADVFEQLPITPVAKRQLFALASFLMTRPLFPDSLSGVVIAGFGEEEYFPGLVKCDMQSVLLNKVKFEMDPVTRINSQETAVIQPFAQREMVDLFMTGIDPTFRHQVERGVGGLLEGLPTLLLEGLDLESKMSKEVTLAMGAASQEILRRFRSTIDLYAHSNHVHPIIDAVASLPKEGLAEMAESLVNLTSFKRRVTMDPETVGGPIDVAVISKGDGFIWIKRKHYFQADRNPQFFAQYRR